MEPTTTVVVVRADITENAGTSTLLDAAMMDL